ncbi:MAG: hypothetical protein JNK76_04465 [Planctomycetales bacterium]|nr:hypothetical protein [Planctomycetales bacterium]MBN8625059.1 hypothetical protein [Planctomycetota bacterium]
MILASPPRDESLRPLRRTLAAVRRRIRTYVAVEGLATTIAAVCAAFWAALAIDRVFEPRPAVRAALIIAGTGFVAVVFYRKFFRRFFARFSDSAVALLLERRFKQLDESLLTSVELKPASLTDNGRAMLAVTREEAGRRLADVRLHELFDARPRRIAVALALLLTTSIAGFAVARPDLLRFGVERLLGRTNELWPRYTHLTVDGFVDGERVVPRGADLDLIVRADAAKQVPSTVYLYYESEDGGVEEELVMDLEGKARPGVDSHQLYKAPLRGLASTLLLDIRGGDARLRDLKIRVVERPRVSLDLDCKYPPYTGRADGLLKGVSGIVLLPKGTIVTVLARSDKPLRRVEAKVPDGRSGVTDSNLEGLALGADAQQFTIPLGPLNADAAATLHLIDTDGIDNTEVLTLRADPDVAPKFENLARKGVDASVTPQARLPLVGKAADDYGLARLWFDYALDGGESRALTFGAKPDGARELAIDEVLEVRDLAAPNSAGSPAIGQTFTLTPKAQDNRHLPDEPEGNVTTGDVFTFTVVSDADLLRLLEGREIMFREQFKALIEKVTRDRDSLVSVVATPSASAAKPADAEDDDLPTDRSRIIVDQARNHTKENRQETLVVAGGFAGIVEEIINNRVVEGDRLRQRLSDDIAAPLKRLGELRFPVYEEKLTALKLLVDRTTKDPAAIEAARREALREADAILIEMNVVLNKMLELESFKEAVDLLRAIIAMQKEVGEKTGAQRQSKARLLGD